MVNNSEFKILVVDDEIFNVEVVQGFLEDEEYQVYYETHPKQALARIFKESFDLILLDINMPELNGLELAKRVKNDPQTKDIPIMFLSAMNDTETITQAFNEGGVDYITKPFNGLELLARVKTHIELRHYIKELEKKQEKLAQIISTDPLTSLPNRLRFLSMIKQETKKITESPSRLSLMHLRIDKLDKLNSIYGFRAVDKAVLLLSQLLRKSLDEKYTVCRVYGSEFTVIMPDTSLESAKAIAKKLLLLIKENENSNIKLTCSIGVEEYLLGEECDKFLFRVNKLLHEASENGGDQLQ